MSCDYSQLKAEELVSRCAGTGDGQAWAEFCKQLKDKGFSKTEVKGNT